MRVRLDHIGIAVKDLEAGSEFWRLLGLEQGGDESVQSQGVNVRFFESHDPTDSGSHRPPRIELLEATGPDTPIGRFLTRHGPGVQQVAFRVDDLESLLLRLSSAGVRLIDRTARTGAGGCRMAFVHPESTGGVLVELVQDE